MRENARWMSRLTLGTGLWLAATTAAGDTGPGAPVADATAGGVFAVVGDQSISTAEYHAALDSAVRHRFFHRQPTEQELAELRAAVVQGLVDHRLLLAEARRRGLTPDAAAVAAAWDRLQTRLAGQSADQRAAVRRALEEDSLLERLESEVKTAARGVPLDEAALRAYYDAHADKFTTPAQLRVSVILLKVDPASPARVWEAAHARAQSLAARVRTGEDFAELAQSHSDDASAAAGGDLGLVHAGRFAPEVTVVLEGLAVGETSAPVVLLQGVALFRVTAREPARLNEFADVRERARALLGREREAAAWDGLIARLRAGTPVRMLPAGAQGAPH